MAGDVRLIGRTRTDSAFAIVIAVGVVAVAWFTVVVGLVSFGPGSTIIATALLGVSVMGWVTTPLFPLPRLVRFWTVGVVVLGSIVLGGVVGHGTPPRAEAVERELETIATPLVDWDGEPSTARPLAPWEAPVAAIHGDVRSGLSGSLIEVVESELVEQGFSVTVLHEAPNGRSLMDESQGAATVLAAERGRWNLRASFHDDQIWLRLAWTPLISTNDPLDLEHSFDGWGGVGTFLVTHGAAAVAAFVGVGFTVASACLAVGALVGWLSQRRDRTSMAGGGAVQDRSAPPDPQR